MSVMNRLALLLIIAAGCATREPGLVKTQVITFPDGGIVEYNGQVLGRAPASVILPQDADGRLMQRAVVRASPNTGQEQLFAQNRVFEPGQRTERVPDRIMIDLRLPGTNQEPATAVSDLTPEGQPKRSKALRRSVPRTDRSKPTQAVGIDRWNPGVH